MRGFNFSQSKPQYLHYWGLNFLGYIVSLNQKIIKTIIIANFLYLQNKDNIKNPVDFVKYYFIMFTIVPLAKIKIQSFKIVWTLKPMPVQLFLILLLEILCT